MAFNGKYTFRSCDRTDDQAYNRRLNQMFADLYGVYWRDLREQLNGKNLLGVPGTADYDFDENWIVLQNGGSIDVAGDVVSANYQLDHDAVLDAASYVVVSGGTYTTPVARLHMHWVQTTETSRTVTGKYRIQPNGGTPAAAWTDFTATCTAAEDNVFPWAAGGVVQVTRLATIDLSDIELSDIIQVKIARTDANAVNDMYLLYMDMHYLSDGRGSVSEFAKGYTY